MEFFYSRRFQIILGIIGGIILVIASIFLLTGKINLRAIMGNTAEGKYTCPEGYRLEGKNCTKTVSYNAKYTCPTGTILIDKSCYKIANSTSKCPEGYTPDSTTDKCKKDSGIEYKCPEGTDKQSGKDEKLKCEKVSKYTCPTGYSIKQKDTNKYCCNGSKCYLTAGGCEAGYIKTTMPEAYCQKEAAKSHCDLGYSNINGLCWKCDEKSGYEAWNDKKRVFNNTEKVLYCGNYKTVEADTTYYTCPENLKTIGWYVENGTCKHNMTSSSICNSIGGKFTASNNNYGKCEVNATKKYSENKQKIWFDGGWTQGTSHKEFEYIEATKKYSTVTPIKNSKYDYVDGIATCPTGYSLKDDSSGIKKCIEDKPSNKKYSCENDDKLSGKKCIQKVLINANYRISPKKVTTANAKTIYIGLIGNSKTKYDNITYPNSDISNVLEKMIVASGKNVNISTITDGGGTLYEKAKSSVLENQIKATKFDYIVLQEKTNIAQNNVSAFKLGASSIKELLTNKDTKIFIRTSWPINDEDFSANMVKIDTNTKIVSNEIGGKIIDDGKALSTAKNKQYSLFNKDNNHSNELGTYLSAACIYKNIFGVKASSIKFYNGINSDTAKDLLSIADNNC